MSVEELRNLYYRTGADEDEDRDEDDNSKNTHRKDPEGNTNTTKPDSAPSSDTTKRPRHDEHDGNNGQHINRGNREEKDDEGLTALKSLKESEERAKATVATRPFLLTPWVKLRAYQQVGLNWLVSIQTRRLNGILADEMGLGKTLQTISLLAYLAAYKGIWGPHLVIVPTSCIVNWETEIKRFCPSMKVLCYYGTAKRRKELRTGWTKVRCWQTNFRQSAQMPT